MSSRRSDKRPASDDMTTEAVSKRFRSAVDDSLSHLSCAITFELPLDPVTAEDGHIYERSAIEDWLKIQKKSPRTNEPMGSKLLPALQVRAMIESLVKSGTLEGEKAAAWQEKIKLEEEVRALHAAAEGGDAIAMFNLGIRYHNGEYGCKQDYRQSFRWTERAAKLGQRQAIGVLGLHHLAGDGVEQSLILGMMLLTEAATAGDARSCSVLGAMFEKGIAEVARNLELARKWYERARRFGEADPSNYYENVRKAVDEYFEAHGAEPATWSSA